MRVDLREAVDTQPHWLYLITSGNSDDVYKIGYTSRTVEDRLEEIRVDYCVPRASILNKLKVIGYSKVIDLEKSIHDECDDCLECTYSGHEWFELEPRRLKTIQRYYQ